MILYIFLVDQNTNVVRNDEIQAKKKNNINHLSTLTLLKGNEILKAFLACLLLAHSGLPELKADITEEP